MGADWREPRTPKHPVSVVLVHGGFLGPWSWADVVTGLDRFGIATVVPDLPSMGDPGEAPLGDFYADAGEVRRVLDSLSGPVLLCGHSYGGAVITEAAAGPHPSVAHLVYLAARCLTSTRAWRVSPPRTVGKRPRLLTRAMRQPSGQRLAPPEPSYCHLSRVSPGSSTTARLSVHARVRSCCGR